MPGETFGGEISNEAVLVRAATDGDGQAFLRLIELHDQTLRALVHSMTGSQSGMDDVLQDAYLKAFRSIGAFKSESSFKTWLWRIVHNATIDELRRESRITLLADPSDTFDSFDSFGAANTSSDSLDNVAMRVDIDAALQKLTPVQRATILLVDGEGFDYATAAEILGVPPGTVSSRINQARTSLRQLLAPSHKDTER